MRLEDCVGVCSINDLEKFKLKLFDSQNNCWNLYLIPFKELFHSFEIQSSLIPFNHGKLLSVIGLLLYHFFRISENNAEKNFFYFL